ncbi:MAG: PilZ domain-containing protein [Labilithrix sp.]|nr:PilZ domain-containing protein [Labilithrix sp.]MCW5809966.1 PilZ domain-containing protein [Labilithrix sp.]
MSDPTKPHFRAHGRRPVRIAVTLRGERTAWERAGTVLDVHIAGAGVETDEPLVAGDRVTVAFATPTRWDPLVISAVVVWAHDRRPKDEVDVLGRPKQSARSGLAFDYESPESTLAMYEMIESIGFE